MLVWPDCRAILKNYEKLPISVRVGGGAAARGGRGVGMKTPRYWCSKEASFIWLVPSGDQFFWVTWPRSSLEVVFISSLRRSVTVLALTGWPLLPQLLRMKLTTSATS